MAKISQYHSNGCARAKGCGCPWRLDYRPLGMNGPRKRLEFPTKKSAERYQSETSHKVTRGEYVDPAKVPTFAEAAERWFASKTDRRPSHVADLRSRLDKHIIPRFGAQRLDRITVTMIEALRYDLRKERVPICKKTAEKSAIPPQPAPAGYAHRTINVIVRIVGAVFKAAIRRGECTTNPVDKIERSFTATRELTANRNARDDDVVSPDAILNPNELGAMLAQTTEGLYRALFTTAALTGARSGELFALRWGDIELKDNPGVYIRRTVSWARLKGEEVRPRYFPPKTRAGVRRIPIPAELVSTLRAWKLQCAPTEDDLAFPTADGRPIRRSNALRYGLWPALRRAGLRQVTMHSLRHSFASALIMDGAPVTEVQALLGHASPAITLKIYSHWFKAVDSGAVSRLSALILGGAKSRVGTKWALR